MTYVSVCPYILVFLSFWLWSFFFSPLTTLWVTKFHCYSFSWHRAVTNDHPYWGFSEHLIHISSCLIMYSSIRRMHSHFRLLMSQFYLFPPVVSPSVLFSSIHSTIWPYSKHFYIGIKEELLRKFDPFYLSHPITNWRPWSHQYIISDKYICGTNELNDHIITGHLKYLISPRVTSPR